MNLCKPKIKVRAVGEHCLRWSEILRDKIFMLLTLASLMHISQHLSGEDFVLLLPIAELN